MGQNVTNEQGNRTREVYGAKGTVYRWNPLEGLKDGSWGRNFTKWLR